MEETVATKEEVVAGKLGDWGRQNSKFLVLKDGDEYTGIYQGFSIVPSHFDPAQTTCAYNLDGMIFNSSSRKLAVQMDNVPHNSKVRIKRKGNGAKTSYSVEVIE